MANNGHQQESAALNSLPWFFGKISREEAETLISPPETGLYLVRESEHFPGDYTLSVSADGRIDHYRISRKGNGLTIDDDVFFRSLPELVEHYKKEADGLSTHLKRHVNSIRSIVPENLRIAFNEVQLKDLIGKGEFSDVYRATYIGNTVAAKKVTCNSEARGIVEEVKLMGSLQHENLVRMYGVAIDGKTMYIVTEFMPNGSLVEFLRTRGRALIKRDSLLRFAKHSCAGMVYLEQMGVVHRDLAARNVLLDEKLNAKVADFGLARNEDTRNQSSKIPIKWTAPEALKNSKLFTSKSDVWNFGILLWEIYNFGRVPYPKTPLSDVQQFIEDGHRMEKPPDCSDEVYAIMVDSWKYNPADRPTFAAIYKKLSELTSTAV